jgi:fibronectin-binding autotransporter adhesin
MSAGVGSSATRRTAGAALRAALLASSALAAAALPAAAQVAIDLNGADVTIPGTIAAPSTPSGPIASPGLDDTTVLSVTNNGAASATLTTGDGNNAAFSGSITDGSSRTGLTLIGGGTLTLSGANTYTGGTTVLGSTVQVTNSIPGVSSSVGTGRVTLEDGLFQRSAR